jgi:dinuclear metal center YbgI/SA1388 family protein
MNDKSYNEPLQIANVMAYLEQIAPLSYQESYDNAGLIVGDASQLVTNVLLSLDCTEEVVDEAIQKKCNLIIAHHPIVFKGLKRLNGSNYIERTVIKAIKNDIAIYAIHTNLDNVVGGVNYMIAEKLQLQEVQILSPKKGIYAAEQAVGAGAVGFLAEPMSPIAFLEFLKRNMKLSVIKHTPLIKDRINKIAVCGGAGGFLLTDAICAKADIFVTSDYKYHEFFDADRQIIICDIGHYESEVFTKELLQRFLSKKFITFASILSEIDTNPVSYYI